MKKQQNHESLFSLFLTFLRFGFLAWGGPVAQIAMIKDELVDQKNWISQEKFKRALAIYQALPGPEAHELCVYFGMIRRGRWGGFIAGLGFMLPGFVFMILLSYLYVTFGAVTLLPLFAGVAPAVPALITRAAHRIANHTSHFTDFSTHGHLNAFSNNFYNRSCRILFFKMALEQSANNYRLRFSGIFFDLKKILDPRESRDLLLWSVTKNFLLTNFLGDFQKSYHVIC